MSAKFGFNNPTQEAMREAFAVFGSAATVSCLLSLGAGQLGVISLDQQGEATHGLSTQMVSDSEGVAEAVHKHIGNLRVYFRFTVDRGLENWDEGRKDFGVLKSHTDAYISKEQVNTALDGCLRACQIPSNITTERLCKWLAVVSERITDPIYRSLSSESTRYFSWASSTVCLLCYATPTHGRSCRKLDRE